MPTYRVVISDPERALKFAVALVKAGAIMHEMVHQPGGTKLVFHANVDTIINVSRVMVKFLGVEGTTNAIDTLKESNIGKV